jgi:hypothetical protein
MLTSYTGTMSYRVHLDKISDNPTEARIREAQFFVSLRDGDAADAPRLRLSIDQMYRARATVRTTVGGDSYLYDVANDTAFVFDSTPTTLRIDQSGDRISAYTGESGSWEHVATVTLPMTDETVCHGVWSRDPNTGVTAFPSERVLTNYIQP